MTASCSGQRPAANTNYSANPLNQYTQVDATAQTPDVNGNLTNDGVLTLGYDSENRLSTAAKSGMSASYAYDPLGRRKSKTVNAVTTSYLHDFDHEIAEYDGAGVLLRRYVYGAGIDQPLAQITAGGTRFYYRQDGINSIVAHEEHASSFVQRFSYGPYGEATSNTGHPFRYTGRRLDEETGLYYYRARMYSTATGRFLQTDPIGYAGELNLYAYVGNDPLNYTDPYGMWSVDINAIFIGGSFGIGENSGLPFTTVRGGEVGAGISFNPSADIPVGGSGQYPAPNSGVDRVEWEGFAGNVGITAGPISYQPVQVGGTTLVREYQGSEYVGAVGRPPSGGVDLTNLSLGSGRVGASLDVGAYYEIGQSYTWSSVLNSLGLGGQSNSGSSAFKVMPDQAAPGQARAPVKKGG